MSIAAAALVVAATGTALSAAGMAQQGRVAKAQGSFQKKVALRNQEVALRNQQIKESEADATRRQGEAELEAAQFDERRIARKQKLIESAELAASAKSGVGLAGASLNALADTAFQFSLDRSLRLRRGQIARNELFERASFISMAGENIAFQGALGASAGRFASSVGASQQRASYISATGSILSGVGQAGLLSTGGGGGGGGSGGGGTRTSSSSGGSSGSSGGSSN